MRKELKWLLILLAGLLLGIPLGYQFGSRKGAIVPGMDDKNGVGENNVKLPQGPFHFQDVTAESGINFTYSNGEARWSYFPLETIGGGVGLIDYDGDGLLDIFFTGGGHFERPTKEIKGSPNRLYKNLGNFKFRDVTKEVGLEEPLFFSHGVAVADYDRDGWPDLLVTGFGRVALYRNVPGPDGRRRFIEVTKEAGLLGDHFWATSAAFADLDGDGFPDVYLCQYFDWSWEKHWIGRFSVRDIPPPRLFASRPHALYHNDGKGHFQNVSAAAGIRVKNPDNNFGKGLGVVIVDVNGDGRPDIYVTNDTTDNFLYLNRSTPGALKFDERGLEMGVAVDGYGSPNGSAGADAGDPFGTGLPSLWVTNYEGELHSLYKNSMKNGLLNFIYATNTSGIAAIGQLYVGFGTGFLDIDNDGWEDIIISNGHVIRHPIPGTVAQKPVLFHNQGKGKFRDITRQEDRYFQTGHRGRGVAIGDLDNDGKPDLVVSHLNEPVAILRNITATENHWLGVELVGEGKRDLVGTRLILEVGGKKLTRFVKGGGSYLSSSDRRQIFGLGSESKPGKLTVEWATGSPKIESWNSLALGQYHRLAQGSGHKDGD